MRQLTETRRECTAFKRITSCQTHVQGNGPPSNKYGIEPTLNTTFSVACFSLVLAGESAIASNNLVPLARVVAWHEVGCDPAIMGIGPVDAIRGALTKAGLTLADMDIVEVCMVDEYRVSACSCLRYVHSINASQSKTGKARHCPKDRARHLCRSQHTSLCHNQHAINTFRKTSAFLRP